MRERVDFFLCLIKDCAGVRELLIILRYYPASRRAVFCTRDPSREQIRFFGQRGDALRDRNLLRLAIFPKYLLNDRSCKTALLG